MPPKSWLMDHRRIRTCEMSVVSRQWPAWTGLAMKLNFAMPVVGSIVGSAAGLSAFYRGLGHFAGRGIDMAITGAFAMFPTLV